MQALAIDHWLSGYSRSATIPGVGVALFAIVLPLERLEVVYVVQAAHCQRLDVINLPTIFCFRVPVVGVLHYAGAGVPSPNL